MILALVRPLVNHVAVRARRTRKVRRIRVVTTFVSPLLRDLERPLRDMITCDNLLVNIRIQNNNHYPESLDWNAYPVSGHVMFTLNPVR